MKLLTLILLGVFFDSASLVYGDEGTCCPVTLSTTEFDVSHETESFKLYFSPIEYDEDTEMLLLQSKFEITHVDVYESDGSTWKLVVASDKLQLSKAFFKHHDTKLSIHMDSVSNPFEVFLDFK